MSLESIQVLKKIMSYSIIGQEKLIERLIIVLLAKGNMLLEGLLGLAKTRTIKLWSIARKNYLKGNIQTESKISRLWINPWNFGVNMCFKTIKHKSLLAVFNGSEIRIRIGINQLCEKSIYTLIIILLISNFPGLPLFARSKSDSIKTSLHEHPELTWVINKKFVFIGEIGFRMEYMSNERFGE